MKSVTRFDFELAHDDEDHFTIEPIVVGKPEIVGRISAYRSRNLSAACSMDATRLMKSLGRRKMSVFVIGKSWLHGPFRNTGLGSMMYLEAARYAAMRHRAAITADICDDVGSTSEAARRVWSGTRFQKQVKSSGMVSYWVGR